MSEQQKPLLIALDAVESSQISAYGYDAASRTLAVQFKSYSKTKPGSGATYHYYDFPLEAWDAFRAAESKGRYFGVSVKNAGYVYQRQPDGPAPAAQPDVIVDVYLARERIEDKEQE